MEAITIIVPVKDEEVGLEYLLSEYQNSPLRVRYDVRFIFVIDVRTSDSSRKIASEFSDNIIDQKETTGKGAAVKQAVENWKENSTSKIVFLDADGSYSFDSVLLLLENLIGVNDVVSGSRFLNLNRRPVGMSRLHNIGNKMLSKISSIRNGRKITDLCTGLWGFTETALRGLDFNSQGFDLEAELAGLIRRKSLNHLEVQVKWSQRKGGASKLSSLKDGFIIFLRIIRT